MEVIRKKLMMAAVAMILLSMIAPGLQVLCFAQDKPKAGKSSPEAELQSSLREQQLVRVVSVLRTVADGTREWKNPAAASKTQAQIADLIWDADPASARGYLIKAWDTAGRVEDPNQQRSRYRNGSVQTDARREVILVARKRAPDLSRKWLDQMAQTESDRRNNERGTFDDRTSRSSVLLQLAIQSCETNPGEAAALAVESLTDGISFGFQEVLLKLQEKDPNLSRQVFRAALARLQTAGLLDPNELLILNAYLYTPGRTIAANTGENSGHIQMAVARNQPRLIPAAQLDPALAADFLNLAAELLIRSPLPASTPDPPNTARGQISAISALIGKISVVAPEKAAILANRLQALTGDAQFSSAPPKLPEGQLETKTGETAGQYNQRRVDYLEKIAERETTTLSRDIAYAKAALATEVDQYQRGWNLAAKIDDQSLRDDVRDWLTYRATLHFISLNDLERAYELAAKNTDPLQRAASLVVGAQKLIKAKDPNRAAEWLSEARRLLRKVEPDENCVRIAFGIVTAYGRFDRDLAFDGLSEAVQLVNKSNRDLKDEDRAPLVQKFSGLEAAADFVYGTEGFSLKAAISSFEPDVFEETLAAINKITGAELRGLATMELCRNYLKRPTPVQASTATAPPLRQKQ